MTIGLLLRYLGVLRDVVLMPLTISCQTSHWTLDQVNDTASGNMIG